MDVDSGLFSSESITEDHADQRCDQVSDAILDGCLAVDRQSRVAYETVSKKPGRGTSTTAARA